MDDGSRITVTFDVDHFTALADMVADALLGQPWEETTDGKHGDLNDVALTRPLPSELFDALSGAEMMPSLTGVAALTDAEFLQMAIELVGREDRRFVPAANAAERK